MTKQSLQERAEKILSKWPCIHMEYDESELKNDIIKALTEIRKEDEEQKVMSYEEEQKLLNQQVETEEDEEKAKDIELNKLRKDNKELEEGNNVLRSLYHGSCDDHNYFQKSYFKAREEVKKLRQARSMKMPAKQRLHCLNEWFVSVSQYAEIKGVTPQAVRKAIKEGRLLAGKIGKQHILPRPR